jgi:hypothetical protein
MTSATTPVSGQREPEPAAQAVVVFGGTRASGWRPAQRARTRPQTSSSLTESGSADRRGP